MKIVKFIYKKKMMSARDKTRDSYGRNTEQLKLTALDQKYINWGILKKNTIEILGIDPFDKINSTDKKISLDKVTLLPPTLNSPKIILVGLNYKNHAEELNMKIPENPIIFLKPYTSLIGHKNNIIYPKTVKRVDYEAEMAMIIKKKGKYITEQNAKKHILGYTCLNDVTARNIQKKDIQWTRAKSFDTFCPIGPYIETELDPSNLKIKSYLNNKLKQNDSTSNFIFSVEKLISFISKIMLLMPGDIISTGTPSGIGEMKPDDTITIEIENIGKLTNKVKRDNYP